jgi:hypothetical protein
MLRPHLVLRHDRVWIAVAVAALAALATHHDRTTFAPSFTVMTPAAPPPAPAPSQTIVLPAPAPPAADRPSCPPPRRDAPFVVPKLDEDVTRVQAAPTNAGWIAAWNNEHVYVSYDAGATFQRALDGEGTVQDASFDCFGHLIVTRGHKVGVRDGTREMWHEVPGLRGNDDDPGGVLGGGPDIVVVGNTPGDAWHARLAVSSDGARTWAFHDLGDSFESGMGLHGRQHEDGSIDAALALADCMDDELIWVRIHDGAVDRLTDGMPEGTTFGIYGDLVLDDSAWRTRTSDWKELPEEARGNPLLVVPGAFPTIVAGDKTYRLEAGKLRALPVTVEGTPQVVDLAGRIWSVACGQLLIAKKTPTNLPRTCEVGD